MQFFRLSGIAHMIVFTGLLVAGFSSAQEPPTPPTQRDEPVFLFDVLERLQENLIRYRSTVPDMFCDEHVVSEIHVGTKLNAHTTTDSIFRLKRSETKTESETSLPELDESREIKTVNNKPAESDTLTGPAIFSGAFSNALGMVSLSLERCFDYRLVPAQQLNGARAIVIEYSQSDAVRGDRTCPGPQHESGRAFIDPKTMQVIRLEMLTPHYEINPGVFGPWTWTVDYAPVAFDKNLFWMPLTISSKAVDDSRSKKTEWSFVATYRNYHKLAVTSRIIPDVSDNPRQ